MSTVVLTGTRAPVAVELAAHVRAAGHEVIAADSRTSLLTGTRLAARGYRIPPPRWQPDAFAAAVLGIARRHGATRVIPVCEEAVWLSTLAERDAFAALRPLLVAPRGDAARGLHHKGRFARLLASIGVAAPRTIEVTSTREARRAHTALRSDTIVLKPAHSRFADATLVVRQGQRIAPLGFADAQRPWIAQEFLDGPERCATVLLRGGEVVAFVAYRPDWRARDLGNGTRFEALPDDDPASLELRAIAERLGRALDLDGFIGIDAIVTPDRGVVPIECNPRPTSGVHLFGEGLADALLGGAGPVPIRRGRASARRVPFAGARHALRDPAGLHASRSVLAGRVPLARQARVVAELAAVARRHRVTLTAASTIDLRFDGTEPPRGGAAAPVRYPAEARPVTRPDDEWGDRALRVLRDPAARMPNAPVEPLGMRVGDALLPVTTPAPPGSAYPASIVSHYLDTARDELHELRRPALERAIDRALASARPVAIAAGLNDAVLVDNPLLSTALHPDLSIGDVRAITATLARAHPRLAIGWRGVHAHGSELAALLRETGHLLVPARSVLFLDTATGAHRASRDYRRDAAMRDAGPYRVRRIDASGPFTDRDAARCADLYEQLYRRKYTPFSPVFTAEFLRRAVAERMIELAVLERDGRIDGVVGWYARGGLLTTPVVGYDLEHPQAVGLYRVLSATMADAAAERGLRLHASSGVPAFKQARGAERELEYLAVQVDHLSPARRVAWRAFASLLDAAATALVDRFEL